MNILDALPPIPRSLITLDFESYYSKDYSLSKLTTEAYVRDPRFEVIGVGVKVGSRPSVWMEERDFRAWTRAVPWHATRVLAHHAHLEGLILHHHYDVRPGFWLDTLSMGRALFGGGGPGGAGLSLAALADYYGIGRKGDEVERGKGKGRRDFTPEQWLRYGVYGCNDVDLTYQLAAHMVPTFPPAELWLIDTTIRMFSEPVFEADQDVLARTLKEEKRRKRSLLAKIAGVSVPEDDAHLDATLAKLLEATRATLSSSEKFAALLRTYGETPGEKRNAKGELIYAFAKSDPYMQGLLEHANPDLRALAEVRLTVKSTIVETRTERMMGIGRRGAVPFYLKYSGAHTHRWSGGDKFNPQNMNRGGALRAAVRAPAALAHWMDGYGR